MFAASSAIGAVSILICGLVSDAVLWGAMRILIGFSNAVAFAVMDGWLSAHSTQENRGRILSINQTVILAAMFSGQFLLNVADPSSQQLFLLSGILLCLAVIPVTTSRNQGPNITEFSPMPIVGLFRLSPLGITSAFFCGILYSSILFMLPVFSVAKGFSDLEVSLIMGAVISGAFLLQFPVGHLSDRYDRRTVLLCILLVAMMAALAVPFAVNAGWFWLMLLSVAITGGIVACLYPLSISETFDRLRQNELVAAMGGIIAMYAGGSILGPAISAIVMERFGADRYFFFIAAVQFLLVLFTLFRMQMRESIPVNDQEEFVMHDATISAIELDPRTIFVAKAKPRSQEAKSIAIIAKHDPDRALELADSLVTGAPESEKEQAVELASALAEVDDSDALQLYDTLTEAAPSYRQEIAKAIAVASPGEAAEIIPRLIEDTPDNPAEAVIAITQVTPRHDIKIIEAAAEASVQSRPEDASKVMQEIVENFASNLADTRNELRHADKPYDQSNRKAAKIVRRLAEISSELAADAATVVVETMPEVAQAVVEATPEVAEGVFRALHEHNDGETI